MLADIRNKLGPIGVTLIIGFIAMVFVFFGVFVPDPSYTGGGLAGSVNGEPITSAEFSRELNRKLEMYRNFGFDQKQLKNLKINDSVFQELVDRKLLAEAAEDMGLVPSEAEIREEIVKMPVFQKDGQFDKMQYQKILEANQLTPGSFEKLIRSDIALNKVRSFLGALYRSSDREIESQHGLSQDRRELEYVILTGEAVRSQVKIQDSEVAAYLKDETKKNLVKDNFEARKDSKYKGKKLEDVQTEIAKEMIALDKRDALKDEQKRWADRVLGMLNKGMTEKAINDALKPINVQLRKSPMMSRLDFRVTGVGENKEMLKDAFSGELQKPKIYDLSFALVVARVSKSEKLSEGLNAEKRAELSEKAISEQERVIYQTWLDRLRKEAKIKKNESVVQAG